MLFHAESVHSAFLSTPSARRATAYGLNLLDVTQISIHALREEGDLAATNICEEAFRFLSTPSARRATGIKTTGSKKDILISIHALREEGDRYCLENGTALLHFYPRPPRGGRPDCFNPAKR